MQEGIQSIINSKSKTFLMFCFCFITGVGISTFLEVPPKLYFLIYFSFFLLLFFLCLFFRKPKERFIFLSITFLFFGILRVLFFSENINSNHIASYNDQGLVEFSGQVIDYPDTRIDKVYYLISAQSLLKTRDTKEKNIEILPKKIFGRVKISNTLYPVYNYGDILQIKCRLKTPNSFNDFNYEKYLEKDRIYSVCYSPEITFKGSALSSIKDKIWGAVFNFKKNIAFKTELLWPEAQSSFMAGILYGFRGGLPEELTLNFNRAGLTHIIAVSGYNIGIVSAFLLTFFIYLGFYRRQAFYLVLTGIFLFVIFTGASASVVRAGVMGVLILIAQYFGRPRKIFNLIIFTLAVMLWFSPMSLWYDVGFQLSFVSVLGVIYLTPYFERLFFNKLKSCRSFVFLELIKIFSATLGATIATLPLILCNFGRFSVFAPLSNILVLWIIPYLMLLGFLALFFSFIYFPFAWFLAFLANVGVNYVLFIINTIGGFKYSAFDLNLPPWGAVIIYIIFVLIWQRKIVQRFIHNFI